MAKANLQQLNTVRAVDIFQSVFEAVEEKGFLQVGVPVSLEYLAADHDGIFKNNRAWLSFISRNFGDAGPNWGHFLPRWCYPVARWQNLFVVKVSPDVFVSVDSRDLTLEYTYEFSWPRHGTGANSPVAVEIFVTAKIK